MKRPKLKNTLLSITCLSGLVSCYPVAPMNPNTQEYRPSGLLTPAELDAAARERAAADPATALELSKERLEREERERLEAERREALGYRDTARNGVNEAVPPVSSLPPVVKPGVVKFAAPVKGKLGFVYNPYTSNQVDVRGIPSGTKVRDPHDSNPAHIFKVP
ncbi:MAG: hypothetical protein ACI9E1_000868 [Cryomorphaceae bacterium]|jgi:hypothetical protein